MNNVFAAGTRVIIFHDPQFPGGCSQAARDSMVPLAALPPTRSVDADGLASALTDDVALFISCHGSYFPKAAWTAILRFCERGGHLAILGGHPSSTLCVMMAPANRKRWLIPPLCTWGQPPRSPCPAGP